MDQQIQTPLVMDKHLDVLHSHAADGGLLLGASCLTGCYWLGSLWYFRQPEMAPDFDRCTAGVQLEAGVCDATWVDSTHVLVGLDIGGVALWNLQDDYSTFVQSHAASGHDDVVTSVSVTCDRLKAASSSNDKCIKLWDLSEVSLEYSARAHVDIVSCVDCHPSETNLLVSCGQDDRILLWDRRKDKPASFLKKSPIEHTPTCVRWQPGQSHKMAVGSESGQVAILDIRMGVDNYLSYMPHDRPVYSLRFCPNKPSLLASVGEDCRTCVCSISEEGLDEIYRDSTHEDFVHGVTWSNSQLYTCGWDKKVVSHDIHLGSATILGQSTTSKHPVQVNGDVKMQERGELSNGDHHHKGQGDCSVQMEKVDSSSPTTEENSSSLPCKTPGSAVMSPTVAETVT